MDATRHDPADEPWPMAGAVKRFERAVVMCLMALLMIVITLSIIELGWLLLKDIISPPIVLLDVDELLDLFGFFLLILIGVELLDTVKAYLKRSAAHIEIVLEVALIAVARKVIALDLTKYSGLTVLGMAALILTLAVSVPIIRRQRGIGGPNGPAAEGRKDLHA